MPLKYWDKMADKKLLKFAQQLRDEVLESAWSDEDPQTSHEKFTGSVLDSIMQEGQWPDHELAYFKQNQRGEVSAWGLDEDRSVLYLAVTEWISTGEVITLTQKTVDDKLKRLSTFFMRAIEGKYQIEEGTEAEELCRKIEEREYKKVEFHFLTNLQPTNRVKIPQFDNGLVPISSDLWGLEKIAALMTSGQSREIISVDFSEQFDTVIPCLPSKQTRKDFPNGIEAHGCTCSE